MLFLRISQLKFARSSDQVSVTALTPPVDSSAASKNNAQPFYFNLNTAAFNELRRQTEFRWASQERLSRYAAQQAVHMGEEKSQRRGFSRLQGRAEATGYLALHREQLLLLNLTTGYGLVLGTWCVRSVEEEQGALLAGGIRRKQTFSLEFTRYGDDMQNA